MNKALLSKYVEAVKFISKCSFVQRLSQKQGEGHDAIAKLKSDLNELQVLSTSLGKLGAGETRTAGPPRTQRQALRPGKPADPWHRREGRCSGRTFEAEETENANTNIGFRALMGGSTKRQCNITERILPFTDHVTFGCLLNPPHASVSSFLIVRIFVLLISQFVKNP